MNNPSKNQNSWPEDKMQELLHCWNVRHLSQGQCASHFDVTRNIIAGKISRFGTKYGFEKRGSGRSGANGQEHKRMVKRAKLKPKVETAVNVNNVNAARAKQAKNYGMRGKLPDADNKAVAIVGRNGLADSIYKPAFKEPMYETAAHNVNIWDLKASQCSWPVSGSGADTMYCGAGKTRNSYCRFHATKAYT